MAEPAPRRPNAEWFARARRVIPGGVDSPVRSFAVGGRHALHGRLGRGALRHRRRGHAVHRPGPVLRRRAARPRPPGRDGGRVAAAAARGTTFGAPTPGEVLLAEAICARVPGCEQVRLVSSGTEAAMSAVRLARGVTGRDRIVKFDGCYHGHSDGLLAGGGSGVATLGLPGLGRRAGGRRGRHRGRALQRRAGARRPRGLRHRRAGGGQHEPGGAGARASSRACAPACDAAGALLIFDEVITGFRLGPGRGHRRGPGCTPDLWCFGKVIGGGLPVGAFGGRRELMADLAPAGPVYQAGTLSGNPLATAAGLAVLGEVGPADYDALARAGRRSSPRSSRRRSPPAASRQRRRRWGRWWGCSWRRPADAADRAADRLRRRPRAGRQRRSTPRFFHAMLRRGVALAPGPYEVLFPGLAHDEAVLTRVVEAAAASRPRGRLRGACGRWTQPDFEALTRVARAARCADRARTRRPRPAGVRGPVVGRLPRALPGATGLRVRDLEGPPRGGADGAVRRGGGGVLERGGARRRERWPSAPVRPR